MIGYWEKKKQKAKSIPRGSLSSFALLPVLTLGISPSFLYIEM